MILARVPLSLHPKLRLVCHSWRAIVNSVKLLKVRQEVNFVEDFMCVCSHEPDNIWQLHDAQNNVWITAPVLPSKLSYLSYFGAVSTAGKLYVLGGVHVPDDTAYGRHHTFPATNQVWSYEPVTRRWTLCEPMIKARANFACGVLDGMIIVAGGLSTATLHWRPIKQVEMYDPTKDVWIQLPDLLYANNAPCYGVVVRRKLHVVHRQLSAMQVLDKETRVWTLSRCPWRNYPRAVIGNDVYVMCNEEFYHESQVREKKEPKFTAVGYNKISGFAVTSLGNRIYLVGGYGMRGDIFNSEIYELSDVTILTPSLQEPWALHHASPMTRCRGTILGCTPLRM
ncbi:hypothetical protein ACET3Z_019270 [Daucus carota]